MTLQNFLSAVRAILILVGSYIVGHSVFGHTVSADMFQVITGAVITLGSMVWGIATKTATVEGIESAVRSIISALGGLFAAAGVISNDNLNAILGVITAIAPFFQSALSKSKGQQVATGAVTMSPTTGMATSKIVPPQPAKAA